MNSGSSIHNRKSLLQRMYIKKVLQEEGENLRDDHVRKIKRFTNSRSGRLAAGPSIKVKNNGTKGGELEVTHLKHQRFLDLKKSRNSRRFPIHNKVIFGHTSDIIRALMYGYTEEIKLQLEQKYKTLEL